MTHRYNAVLAALAFAQGTCLLGTEAPRTFELEAETSRDYLPLTCAALRSLTQKLQANSHMTLFHDSTVGEAEKALIRRALSQEGEFSHHVDFRSVESELQALPDAFQPIWQNMNTIMNDDGKKLFIAIRPLFPVFLGHLSHTIHLDMDAIVKDDLSSILAECLTKEQPIVSARLDIHPREFAKNELFKEYDGGHVSGGLMVFNWAAWLDFFKTMFGNDQQENPGDIRSLTFRWLSNVFDYVRHDGLRFAAYWELKPGQIMMVREEEGLFSILLQVWKERMGHTKISFLSPIFNSRPRNRFFATIFLQRSQNVTQRDRESLQQYIDGKVAVWHWDHEPKPLALEREKDERVQDYTFSLDVATRDYFRVYEEFLRELSQNDTEGFATFMEIVQSQCPNDAFLAHWLLGRLGLPAVDNSAEASSSAE